MTVDDIFKSRESFNEYTYTHWEDALTELAKRDADADLEAYAKAQFPHGLPPIMEGKKSMVLFRHIATPNYEIHRFLICADALDTLQPLILEYTADKFNNRNEMKFVLGKIPFHKGFNKLGEPLIERSNIIDINASNNRPISEIETSWGQKLVDFHHEMFDQEFPHLKGQVFDLSSWLHAHGPAARDYYKGFLALFLRDAILFENFMIERNEDTFTRDIIMPAMLELEAECGYKPLIIALEPTHIEGDQFWLSHPFERKQHIDRKLGKSI